MNHPLPTEIQELHAYVDGELSPEKRQQVETRLTSEPDARRLVDEYTALRLDLHALFDPVLDEPVPATMRRRQTRWERVLGAVAAGLFLLATGIWTGLQLQADIFPVLTGAPHVVREAAMAYAVYTPEVRHAVEVPGNQEQHLVTWLTKRLGGEVRAPKLDELGFKLMGGRLLASDDGPGALFMYENRDGRRVTLHVCHSEKAGRNTAFRYAEQNQISVFYWYDGPFSYALAGDFGRSGLLELVESVYHQIDI